MHQVVVLLDGLEVVLIPAKSLKTFSGFSVRSSRTVGVRGCFSAFFHSLNVLSGDFVPGGPSMMVLWEYDS